MKKHMKEILLLVGIVALLVIVGVSAYFFESMAVVNPFSVGQAKIYLKETFDPSDKWVPGEEKRKEVIFGNEGTVEVVLRARFDKKLTLKGGTEVTDPDILAECKLNFADGFTDLWQKGTDGWYYYKKVVQAEDKTEITLKSVTISDQFSNYVHGVKTDYTGATLDVDIKCEAIQASVKSDSKELQGWAYSPVVSGTNVSWATR